MTIARQVYVISDLHIGGAYPDKDAPHPQRQRGFRMMTRVAELAAFVRQVAHLPAAPAVELVINGDFIDFLAEEKGAGVAPDVKGAIDPYAAPSWTPFRASRGEALAAYRALVVRDQVLFTALRELLAAGKTLTVVLGNHDLELCLPDVRAALTSELGSGSLRFLDDGQALDLGDVLIDHGNAFDPANVVDHDQLRVVRALYSRGWFENIGRVFAAPAGSKLVAQVMNGIKADYGFIDLLKPESEALIALLLAIEPGYRREIDEAAAALSSAAKTLVPRPGAPFELRNVAARRQGDSEIGLRNVAASAPAQQVTELDELLASVLANDPEAATSLRLAGKGAAGQVEVAGNLRARWSLIRLLLGSVKGDLDARIAPVQATLRALVGDSSFTRDQEQPRYLKAAKWLASPGPHQKGYKAVVFGHTHHAKSLPIPDTNARYLNTGTWANLMCFPEGLWRPDATREQVRAELLAFAGKLQQNDLADCLRFEPTYVRIDLDGSGALLAAELHDYDWENERL